VVTHITDGITHKWELLYRRYDDTLSLFYCLFQSCLVRIAARVSTISMSNNLVALAKGFDIVCSAVSVLIKTTLQDVSIYIDDNETLNINLEPNIYEYNEVLKYHNNADEIKVNKNVSYDYDYTEPQKKIDIVSSITRA
jgi:uncharacterized protein YsxB (DUF464 family)